LLNGFYVYQAIQ